MTTDEIKTGFCTVAMDLSPENLTCDGELSQTEVARRYKSLKLKWKMLERAFGRTVTEDEVWSWMVK